MINNKKVHALLMIREGSVRIPNKAFVNIHGKPLIKIAVDKVLRNEYIDKVYISTSSEKYKELIKDYGCEIIDRPEEYSKSHVINLPVFRHAINVMDLNINDYFVYIDFTKPFLNDFQINYMIESMESFNLDSAFTCKKIDGSLVGINGEVSQFSSFRMATRFSSVRVHTKVSLVRSKDNVYGQGERHMNFPIIKEHEIDLNHPWQLAQFMSLVEYGFKYE